MIVKRYLALQKALKAQKAKKKPQKRNKYNAKKCVIDGCTFDSLREGNYYIFLKRELAAGDIMGLKLHPRYPIAINEKLICNVELDFAFFDNRINKLRYIDVKGFPTNISKLKKKMVEAQYGIEVEWVK